jgi:hypothetical protein
MGALRLDSARPFDAKIEIHCAKYFKISVATPRPLKFSFSTNSRKLAEQKNPQPVGQIDKKICGSDMDGAIHSA